MAEEDMGAEETTAGEATGAAQVDGKAMIATCISLLASKAWEAMGLVSNPATKKIERNLDDAQLAIDGAAALAALLLQRVPDDERRDLENLIANLRINFVDQKTRHG